MDYAKRQKYADAIDRFLEEGEVRERFRDDALGMLDSLGIDLDEQSVARLARGFGLVQPGAVAVPAVPLVVVGVMVASQIRDTPADEPDTDTDGGTDGGTDGD